MRTANRVSSPRADEVAEVPGHGLPQGPGPGQVPAQSCSGSLPRELTSYEVHERYGPNRTIAFRCLGISNDLLLLAALRRLVISTALSPLVALRRLVISPARVLWMVHEHEGKGAAIELPGREDPRHEPWPHPASAN